MIAGRGEPDRETAGVSPILGPPPEARAGSVGSAGPDLSQLPPPPQEVEAVDLPPPPPDAASTSAGPAAPDASERYRSAKGPALYLRVVLGVMMVVSAIALAFDLVDYRLWARVDNDPLSVRVSELEATNDRLNAMAVIQLVVALFIVIGFMIWSRRLYQNVAPLDRRFKAGWATWGWLVPIMNWFRPWQVLHDVWKGSQLDRGSTVRAERNEPQSSMLMKLWWGSYIAMVIISFRAEALDISLESAVEDRRTTALWLVAVDALQLLAAALAFLVVAMMTQRQQAWADSLAGAEPLATGDGEARSTWSARGFFGAVVVLALAAIPITYFVVSDGEDPATSDAVIETAPSQPDDGGGEAAPPSTTDAAEPQPMEGEGVLLADLKVGDCFTQPADHDPTATELQAVFAVERVPCSTPHFAEVAAITWHPAGSDAPYPGDAEVALMGFASCSNAAGAYVDAPVLAAGLDLFLIQPGSGTWVLGDRRYVCAVTDLELKPLDASVRGSGGIVAEGHRNAFGLQVGDCFDDTTSPNIALLDCGEPHDNEVYAVFTHPGDGSEPFPGQGEIGRSSTDECGQLFDQSVNPAVAGSLDFGAWTGPLTRELWAIGVRDTVCVLWNRDLTPLTQSQIAAEASPPAGGRDLVGADLAGADLVGENLIDAHMAGANLEEADLTGARLNGADLSGANLAGAILVEADLLGTDLSDADLRGADLNKAFLPGADLSGADLTDANLVGAWLSAPDLPDLVHDENTTWPQGFTPPPSATSAEHAQMLAAAIETLDDGQLTEAIDSLTELIELEPADTELHASAHLHRSLALIERSAMVGQLAGFDEAVADATAAIGLEPADDLIAEALRVRAIAAAYAGDFDQTVADALAADDLEPGSAHEVSYALTDLVMEFETSRRYELEVGAARAALEIGFPTPDDTMVGHLNLGSALDYFGDDEESIQESTTAIEMGHPDSATVALAYLNRAGALADLGRYEQALADAIIGRDLTADDTSAWGRQVHSWALEQVDQWEAAVARGD